jgi:archaellum component FlaC
MKKIEHKITLINTILNEIETLELHKKALYKKVQELHTDIDIIQDECPHLNREEADPVLETCECLDCGKILLRGECNE